MSAQAKTIWQTIPTHSASNLERNLLFARNRLCVEVFAKGLSAAANALSLFSGVVKNYPVEENQQTPAPPVAETLDS